MYNKLFSKILDSSIWMENDATRLIWFTMLASMDQDGFCQFASIKNLAHRAIVKVEDAEKAVKILESPDPESSDDEYDGRRIERINGGWIVLNKKKYHDLATKEHQREQTRQRVKKHRDKSVTVTQCNANVTHSNEKLTPSDTYTDANPYTNTDTLLKSNTILDSNIVEQARPRADNISKSVLEIFEYWQKELNHPKAILDAKRKKAIQARLREGYSISRLKEAITGVKRSKFHMGDNDRNTVFDDIELICRSGASVDKFAEMKEVIHERRSKRITIDDEHFKKIMGTDV